MKTFHCFDFLIYNMMKHRVQTSYVTVEPKRRRQTPLQPGTATDEADVTAASAQQMQHSQPQQYASPGESTPTATLGQSYVSERGGRVSGGRELRRARIVITVKRTESYRQWLIDNPLQTNIAEGDDVDIEDDVAIDEEIVDDPQEDL
jgi:hypothetical protein